ncbi:MAG: 16S rRNA (cytosine(1402)-N(4))-methyltransferase RsmH [Hyphomicrobiaceae bacterium]
MTGNDNVYIDGVDDDGAPRHMPVLLPEVLAALALEDGEVAIDATFGGGGYSRAMLAEACIKLSAYDRDPSAGDAAAKLCQEYPDHFTFYAAPFSTIAEHIPSQIDAIVFDIGVSSMQLDEPARGFSFQADGPLDMRMSAAHGRDLEQASTAADLVNNLAEDRLANLIYQLGDERRSRAISRAICRRRAEIPFSGTKDLAEVVAKAYGRPSRDGRNPATRTFQALRMAVNDELGELARGLQAAETALKTGGRLVVVTFHSLEDRLVKRFFAARAGKQAGTSRHLPEKQQFEQQTFQIINQRPLAPSSQEIARNPRARSAKLRFGIRTDKSASEMDIEAFGLPDWNRR